MQLHSTPALDEERLAQQHRPERAAALLIGSAVSQGTRPSAQLIRHLSNQPTVMLDVPPPGRADLDTHRLGLLAQQLLGRAPLQHLSPAHPEYTWMLYGYLLHQGLPRHVLTFSLAEQHAWHARLHTSPSSAAGWTVRAQDAGTLSLKALREAWKTLRLPRQLQGVKLGNVAEALLGRVPLQGEWTMHLSRVAGPDLLARSHLTLSHARYHHRMLQLQQHLTPLGLRPGETLLSLMCQPDNVHPAHLWGLLITP